MTDWSSLVRRSLLGLDPYRPGPSVDELKETYGLDELAKLNWNEGLLGPFPGVREAVTAELEHAWMYPEHAYTDFREAIAEWLGTRPELIVPGHGIQALIATVAHAVHRGRRRRRRPLAHIRALRAGLRRCGGSRREGARP